MEMSDKRQRGGGKAGGIVACVMAVIKTLSHGTVPRHLLLQATGREGKKKSWRLRHDLPPAFCLSNAVLLHRVLPPARLKVLLCP